MNLSPDNKKYFVSIVSRACTYSAILNTLDGAHAHICRDYAHAHVRWRCGLRHSFVAAMELTCNKTVLK